MTFAVHLGMIGNEAPTVDIMRNLDNHVRGSTFTFSPAEGVTISADTTMFKISRVQAIGK